MIKRLFSFIVIFAIFALPMLYAGETNKLTKNLNKFFNKLGSSGNVTAADVYTGQRAGYATGGGLALRNRVTSDKVATLTLPKFDAGCGGIDLYAGGMSFISGPQIGAQLKSIASGSMGYAFLLGAETLSPQFTNVVKQLQTWANTINGININSCETASAMVGSVWPRDTLAKQQICRSVAGKSGKVTDYVNGRHQCAIKSEYENAMRKMEEQNADMLKEEFNLAWEAIKRQGGCDEDEREIFMSLMGTVIVRKDRDGNIVRDIIPSKINDDSFLKALLNGGMVSTLVCDAKSDVKKERCLIVKDVVSEISRENSWIGKIESKLNVIQNKIFADQTLDTNEQEFLAKSQLPLHQIVNALTAYKQGYCPVELSQIAELVAMDLLMQYLRETIEVVRTGCIQLRGTELYSSDIDSYLKNLSIVEKKVSQHELHNRDILLQRQHLEQLVEKIEQQLSSELIIR